MGKRTKVEGQLGISPGRRKRRKGAEEPTVVAAPGPLVSGALPAPVVAPLVVGASGASSGSSSSSGLGFPAQLGVSSGSGILPAHVGAPSGFSGVLPVPVAAPLVVGAPGASSGLGLGFPAPLVVGAPGASSGLGLGFPAPLGVSSGSGILPAQVKPPVALPVAPYVVPPLVPLIVPAVKPAGLPYSWKIASGYVAVSLCAFVAGFSSGRSLLAVGVVGATNIAYNMHRGQTALSSAGFTVCAAAVGYVLPSISFVNSLIHTGASKVADIASNIAARQNPGSFVERIAVQAAEAAVDVAVRTMR